MYQPHPANGTPFQEMSAALGPDFVGLLKIVQERVPPGLRVIEGHRCTTKGRHYVHVVASDGEHLISLVIALREEGEALEHDVRAVVAQSGVPIYAGSAENLQMAGFETAKHLVFVISNLGSEKNLAAMRAMTPEVSEVLRRVEI
jgi:hypothetical protein